MKDLNFQEWKIKNWLIELYIKKSQFLKGYFTHLHHFDGEQS